MDAKTWTNNIREIRKYNDEVLSLKNGHWQVKNKEAILLKYASFFYDSHLDLIQSISVKVLSERDPMFDLESSVRLAASLYKKVLQYSSALRKGISETLAFLGVNGREFKNCSQHQPDNIVTLTIRELFKNADWKLWASLNDVLPILAEASPDEFLSSVENALKQSPCPFDELFKQEGDSITSSNYMTGSYWALECLAWSKEYLTRAILVLAELAKHDPGGKWVNRPANSIITILLPWYPQTTASTETKIAALRGIQRNYPEIAWKTLLALLPNRHQTSSGSHKPRFRKFISDNWNQEVSKKEYLEQVKEYASMTVEMAKGNIEYVSKLVENFDNIPQPAFDSFLTHLSSEEITGLSDEQKQPIWETIKLFIKKHRRFSDAKWALPTEKVDSLEEAANRLTPTSPEILFRHLFSDKAFDFIQEDIGWEALQEKIQSQQIEALKKIYSIGNTDSIILFAEKVEKPEKVGYSFAQMADNENDKEFLSAFLDFQGSFKEQFISGYILGRYRKGGLMWLEGLNTSDWKSSQKCALLLFLPFENEIWQKVNTMLRDSAGDYWKKVVANPFHTQSSLVPAIDNLLKYERPGFAFTCVYVHYFLKKELLKEQAIKALLHKVSSAESIDGIDTYNTTEIIKLLQSDPDVNENDLSDIEWVYLPLIDSDDNIEPKFLEKDLSQKPEFFIKIIQLVYRSKKETNLSEEVDERKRNLAENGWKLLHNWRRPPGRLDDGSFSDEALMSWYDEVKAITIESGHYEIAMQYLGHVLFYCGKDTKGLWIHQSVAEILDATDNDHIRQGFTSEVYKSRGVHTVDPSGKAERELASHWRKNADDIEQKGFVRFASILRELAKSYDRQAEFIIAEYGTEKKPDNPQSLT